MPGVIPNYKEGPTSWPVCGYGGTGTPTTITGGQLVHPNASQSSMVEPQLAGGLDTLGVASNDAAAPRTSQDSQNPAVISQQPDIVAVYYGVDIDVTFAANANCGQLLVPAASGQVTPYIGDEDFGTVTAITPAATTVASTNSNSFPVNAVVSGATGVSAVKVNGTQVGTTLGTYYVPAGGTIAVTFTGGTLAYAATAAGSTFDMAVGRCSQPGGVVISSNAVGSMRSFF